MTSKYSTIQGKKYRSEQCYVLADGRLSTYIELARLTLQSGKPLSEKFFEQLVEAKTELAKRFDSDVELVYFDRDVLDGAGHFQIVLVIQETDEEIKERRGIVTPKKVERNSVRELQEKYPDISFRLGAFT